MKLKIDPEFKAYIPELTADEREGLRASLLSEGCRDPIVTWQGFVVDGHNRYELCTEHGIPFSTTPLDVPDRAAVLEWMFKHQIGRRNLSPDQITILAMLRGVSHKAANDREARALVEHDPERAQKVLSGKCASIRIAYNAAVRAGKIPGVAPKPRAPRGPAQAPTDPHVPEAHEIRGVSTYTGPGGNVRGQWTKTGLAGGEPEPLPPDFLIKKISTMSGADGTTRVKWTAAERSKIDQWQAFLVASKEHAAEYRGLADPMPAPLVVDNQNLLTVYPLGDPHIGMLSWAPETGDHNDLAIAVRDLLRAIDLAVAAAPASKEAVLVNLGDLFHAQDAQQRTPGHGHKLDVDGRVSKVQKACLHMLRGLIDRLLTKHERVTMYNLPGNHDPEVAAMVANYLDAVYEREPRVTIDDAHRPFVYHRHGKNLIGMAHGDGCKMELLPAIMAADEPEAWGATTFRTWYTGHVHHLTRKEFTGCTCESFRIVAGSDYWHRSKGYRAGRSQNVITLHPEYGEISRQTIDLSLIRGVIGS